MAEPAPPKVSFTKCFLSQQSLLNYHFINRSSQWINCNCKIHRKKRCVWATWQEQHCIKLLTTRTAYYVCCTGGGSGRGGVAVPATRLQPGPPAAGDDLAGGGHRLLVPAQPQLEPLDRRQHWRRLVPCRLKWQLTKVLNSFFRCCQSGSGTFSWIRNYLFRFQIRLKLKSRYCESESKDPDPKFSPIQIRILFLPNIFQRNKFLHIFRRYKKKLSGKISAKLNKHFVNFYKGLSA